MLDVTWPVERTRLAGQALLRRTAAAAFGHQLLREGSPTATPAIFTR